MNRRHFLAAGAASLLAPMINRGRYQLFAASPQTYSARTVELMQRSIVIDMLSPVSLSYTSFQKWVAKPQTFPAKILQDYKDSGLTAIHASVGIGGPNAYADVMQFVAEHDSFLLQHGDSFQKILGAADFAAAKRAQKVGMIIGLQDSDHFRTPADVEFFHAIGQRVSQLTYNARNLIGNGSTERVDGGISDFGVAVIGKMNDVGMAVDVSHCGDQTTLQAFDISKRPVLITHANCRALNNHPRCKTDEAIKKMAAHGGVMGITGVRMFVKSSEPTTIEDVLNQFDHVAKLVGVEHLGVGSDIDLYGYDAMPPEENKALRAGYKGSYAFREKIDIEGLNHPRRMFDLTEGLIRRKYSDADIQGILGGNFQRVLGTIWNA